MTALWILFGAPCAGRYETESTWPPPRRIRAVHDGDGYHAVLDLPDDVPLIGEHAVDYELQMYGVRCEHGRPRKLVASYMRVGLEGRVAEQAASGLEAVA
jgi:hypothetical protein